MFVWGTLHEFIARLNEQFFHHPVAKLMIFPKEPSREVHLESITELQIIYFPSQHNWPTHFTRNISWPGIQCHLYLFFSLNEVYNSCLRCWFYSWSILTLRRASISVVQYLISKHCKNCTNGLYCRNCPYGKFLSLNGLATLKGLVKLGLLYWPQLCILGSKYPTNFITHVVWIG